MASRIEMEGVSELIAILEQTGEKAKRGVLAQMRKEAKEIQRLAREYAPIDEGNLEESITVEDVEEERDERGRFTKKSVAVFIDFLAAGSNGALAVGEYAYVMHELLLPYGAGGYNLGKNSVAKDGGRGVVGGRFLERAVDDVSKGLMNRLIQVSMSYF